MYWARMLYSSTHGFDRIIVRRTRDPLVENVRYVAESRTTLWLDGNLDLSTVSFAKPGVEYTIRDMSSRSQTRM